MSANNQIAGYVSANFFGNGNSSSASNDFFANRSLFGGAQWGGGFRDACDCRGRWPRPLPQPFPRIPCRGRLQPCNPEPERTVRHTQEATETREGNRIVLDAGEGNDKIRVKAACDGGVDVYINGEKHHYTADEAKNLTIKGGDGCDNIKVSKDVCIGLRLEGGAGDDKIRGGSGNDQIYGGAGNDKLKGGRGDDAVYGGAGDDTIKGGRGNDQLHGGAGNDKIKGGRGEDYLYGGAGDDKLKGGKGNDHVYGGDGCDRVSGGRGCDVVRQGGPNGSDGCVKELAPGEATVTRECGRTILDAGAGDDDICVRQNCDGSVTVSVNGEEHHFSAEEAKNLVIRGGGGDDRIHADSSVTHNVRFEGGDGDDVLIGGRGHDRLDGGNGDDVIYGRGGHDHLYGGAGDDVLVGGSGWDRMIGGPGCDDIRDPDWLLFEPPILAPDDDICPPKPPCIEPWPILFPNDIIALLNDD